MAIPNTSYSEIITTTLDNYRDKLADNVLNHNPLLAKLKARGNVDTASGGAKLLENLMYDENGTFKWYSGYETLDTSGSDVLTSASFDWKQCNVNVTMSGLEELQNASKEAVHKLVKARIQVAEKTMQNQVAAALYYANTEHGGKAIGGMQHLIADLPTSGTVGGIDRSSNSWWRNQYYDFSDASVTASSSTITHAMNLMYLRTMRGTDAVDLIVAGETYFTYYEESLQAQQRFMSETKAAGGFNGYRYKGAEVVYDSNCSATRMYLLNTAYFHFRPHANRNFVTLDRKSSVNQDATVVPLYWAGNATTSNPSLSGVIVA
ncbi:MAG: phage major capsid protein [Desulfurellales bacterium]|nr:MAG: phage major capsid protein [Desulfurellales bacterium]